MIHLKGRKMNSVYVFASTSSDPLESNPLQQDVKPVVACRGCLTTERPLRFLNHKMADEFRLLLSPIEACDSCLWYMCSYCCALLVKFRSFRKKCLSAQNALSKNQVAGCPNTLDAIKSISKNLSHPLKKLDLPRLIIEPDMIHNNVNKLIKQKKLGIAEVEQVSIDPTYQIKHGNNQDNQKINLQDTGDTVNKNVKDLSSDPEDYSINYDCTDFVDDSMDVDYLELESLEFEDEKSTIEIMNQPLIDEQNAFNAIKITNFQLSDVKSKKSEKDGISLKIAITSKSHEKRNKFPMIELQLSDVKSNKSEKDGTSSEIAKTSRSEEKHEKDEQVQKCSKNPQIVKDKIFGHLILKVRNKREKRKNKDRMIDEKKLQMLKIKRVRITKEEQKQEMLKRKEDPKYESSRYKCDLCYLRFINKVTFNNHMERHRQKAGHMQCDVCYVYVPKKMMHTHNHQYHTYRFFCGQCDHFDKSITNAKNHYQWHKGFKYNCKICGKAFNKPTSVMGHMHLSHKDVMVKCLICGKECIGEKGLKGHMNHSHKEAIGAMCSCGVQFHSVEALQRHRPQGECDPTTRPCVRCGVGFTSELLLHQHGRTCDSKKQYSCEFCNFSFESQISYKKHVTNSHSYNKYRKGQSTKDTTYICEHCGKNCTTKHLLITHTRKHTGERPFICDYCGKGFTAKQFLAFHIASHMAKQSDKPRQIFSCRYCGNQFTYQANRNRHEITNHKGLMKFNCVICGLTVTTKASMQNHMRHTHEGVPWPKRQRNRR